MGNHRPTPTARQVHAALDRLGGEATTEDIAKEAGMGNNGVSVSLGAMDGRWAKDRHYVDCLGGRRNKTRWKIVALMPD